MKTSFGIKEINALILQLKAENDPSNHKLIAFYENKVQEAINKAYSQALKKLSK